MSLFNTPPVEDHNKIKAKHEAESMFIDMLGEAMLNSDMPEEKKIGVRVLLEMKKVKDIADYLNKYPKATVKITGYADKGTGNAKINASLGERRAQAVVDALVNDFGISASRIKADSKGDTEQPFKEDVLNRVSICIAE